MEKVCRLCLKRTEQNEITDITNEHLQQLRFIIPEIDLKTVKSPLICTNCTKSMKTAHDFKSTCLETEKRLNSYIEMNGMINLKKLLTVDCKNDNKKDESFLFNGVFDVKIEENNEYHDAELVEITDNTLPEVIEESANDAASKSLPTKTQIYNERQYEFFITWCESQNVEIYSENVFLNYFKEKAKSKKSSTLWAIYYVLKSTFIAKHNIDISAYSKLIAFIKEKSLGYNPKHSNVFTRKQVCKFLEEAPDDKYLMWKVCLIFGIAGSCHSCELKNIMTHHIEDKGTVLIITISDTKTVKSRKFTVTNKMFNTIKPVDLYRKYLSLRPSYVFYSNFFIFYSNNKCCAQVIGIHTIGSIPKKIASYLKIGDADSFTAHAFRRTSASLLADSGLVAKDYSEIPPITLKQEI